ncbi:hypothetical protein [Mycoplasma sp. CSL10166]|uniref:hypothetical protein n=1 Tax=Mycoplasma sp. CSL10166 TaxID=2813825 RepID=UPI00197C482D|nr:hypothetical protein [Mycoplasma sp. CSL10166]MBN4084334.1 hypothetical protein [Mycoplasma sp. CSL10166]
MSKIKIIANNNLIINNKIENEDYRDLLNQIKSLNFKGSENLEFDDIAINYSINGIDKIIEYCNLIYSNNVEYLIVWSSKNTELALKSVLNYIFGLYDYNIEKKVKLLFLNSSDSKEVFKEKVNYYFNFSKGNNLAIMFLDGFNSKDDKDNLFYSNYLLDKFSRQASNFLIKKLIYFVGKSTWLKYIDNFNIPNQNIFIVSEQINKTYNILTEICLIVLATQGVNIIKLINGYKNASKYILTNNLYFNNSLKLALYLNKFSKQEQKMKIRKSSLNLFIAYDDFLTNLMNLFANNFNQKTLNKNTFNDYAEFPGDISVLGQSILSNNINKLVVYFKIKQKYFDFQLSSNADYNDLLTNFSNLTMQQFNEISYKSFDNYLTSFNDDVTSLCVEIEKNDEESLGELISLLYWSKIFYCVLNDINPF